jgi:hypothetical protein
VLKDYAISDDFDCGTPGAASFVVKGPRFSDKRVDDLLQVFRDRLGSDFVITVHTVDRIEACP